MMLELIMHVFLWISVLALAYFFFFPYRQQQVDICRSRIFEARNELFLGAANGTLSFDDKAYVMVRTTLNGMIRFAHELNILQAFTTYLVFRYGYKREAVNQYEQELANATKNLSPDAENAVMEALAKAHFAVLLLIFRTSILLVIFKPLIWFLQATHRLQRVTGKFLGGREKPFRVLDAVASQIGCTP